MSTFPEQFWAFVVGFSIAGFCILATLVLSIREKRKTGKWPQFDSGSKGSGWFAWVWAGWFGLSVAVPDRMLHRFPLCILVPGIDLSMLIAFTALAGLALTWVFRAEWSRQTCFWISYCLLLPALTLTLVLRDYKSFASTAWIWILAGLIALFMTPILARLTYAEFYLNRADRVD
jgi:hypothetical protein